MKFIIKAGLSNNKFGYKKATAQELWMIARILLTVQEFNPDIGFN